MLFALPFPILAALVGWEQLLKNTKFIFFISLITLINLFTLIKERKHYDYFAKQSYKTLAEEVSKFDHLKTLVVTDLTLKYLDFYLKQDNTSIDTLSLDKLNSMSFDNVKKNYDYIVTCGVSEALESYFTPYYGSIQPSIQGFGYEIDVLKRQEKAHQNKQNISHTSFTSTEKGWYYNTNNITENNSYLKSENDEWGPNYENALGDSLKQKLLCFQIDYTGDSIIGEQFLVINFIDKAGKEISNNIFPFSIEKKDAGKQTIKALYDLDELPKNVHAIKAFHWKRSKTNISIHQMDLSTLDKLQAVSFITDSLEDVRSFNKRNQENWGELSYNKVLLNNETGQQYFEFDDAKQWLTSYTFDFDYKRTYTLEFEFMADEVSPLSSVILSVKNMDTTVYWTEKRLNTFMKSDNLSWSKATLAIPFSVLNEHDGIPLEISLSAYKGTGPPIKFKNPLIRSYKPNRALYGSTGEIIE